MTWFEPGDIFLVSGSGFFSKAIRFFTRGRGEPRTEITHVGLISSYGTVHGATAIEALRTVRKAPFSAHLGETLTVFRPTNLADHEMLAITSRAERYVGRKYGYGKIVAHALDGLLGGAYVFRRLTNSDAYPICSWLVAHAYLAAGKDFGVKAGAATPDDIADFVVRNPDKYEQVLPLQKLAINS